MTAINPQPGNAVLEIGAWPNHVFCCPLYMGATVTASDSFDWADKRQKWLDTMPKDPAVWPSPEEWSADAQRAGAEVRKVDAQTLNAVEVYDKIYSISVLEHIEDDLAAMKNIWRALKPGGVFAFTTEVNLFHATPYEGGDRRMRIYSLESVLVLIDSSGFRLEDSFTIPPDWELVGDMRRSAEKVAAGGFKCIKA